MKKFIVILMTILPLVCFSQKKKTFKSVGEYIDVVVKGNPIGVVYDEKGDSIKIRSLVFYQPEADTYCEIIEPEIKFLYPKLSGWILIPGYRPSKKRLKDDEILVIPFDYKFDNI